MSYNKKNRSNYFQKTTNTMKILYCFLIIWPQADASAAVFLAKWGKMTYLVAIVYYDFDD